MKYAKIMAVLCALGWCAVAGAQEASWVGQFTVGGQTTIIGLHQSANAPASLDVPAKGARGIPLQEFKFTVRHAYFVLQGGPDLYTFDGIRSATGIAGSVRQGTRTGQFKLVQLQPAGAPLIRQLAGSYQIAPGHVIDMGPMDELDGRLAFLDSKTRRTGPLNGLSATRFVSGPSIGMPYPFAIQAEFIKDKQGAVTALRWTEGKQTLLAKKIAPHRVEEVTVVNGDVTLRGTLLLPLTPGPPPAIVFAHGSGPSTRNVGVWNSFFVRQGMAVLSLDKRGAGASSGDWGKASMATIADDWLAGVAMLKARADIDPKRIGVHGSSQGGWTGPLMAVKSNDVAYLIVRAGSANTVRDTMVHEIGWSVREAGFGEADVQEAHAGAGRLFDNAGLPWPEFSALAAPLKARPWANAVWAVHMSEEGWGRGWSVLNAAYDPAETLAKVKVPVLWFLGELDHNVPSADTATRLAAARQRSGNPDFTVMRLPDAGHAFLATTTGNNSEFPTLSRASAGYWDKMESWLRARRFSQP